VGGSVQVAEEVESLGQYLRPPLRVECVMGAERGDKEEARDERVALVKRLKENTPHILVGTIGRVKDLASGRESTKPVVWLRNLKFMVLDEADEMLSGQNGPQQDSVQPNTNYHHLKDNIVPKTPATLAVVLVSATFSEATTQAAQLIFPQHSFVTITLTDQELNRPNIQQFYVVLHRSDERVWLDELLTRRLRCLEKLVTIFANGQIYVFCRNGDEVKAVMRENSYEGSRFTVNVEDFKSGRKTILVCTNALARGLDVQAASVVINFDLCDPQRYMQRIGRVGRFGRAGTAITLVPPYQVDNSGDRTYTIKKIMDTYHNTIRRWDFLETFPEHLDDFVPRLPGFGFDQSLLDEPPAAPEAVPPAPGT
jgi:ATP-dependent RNA helicase DeaD